MCTADSGGTKCGRSWAVKGYRPSLATPKNINRWMFFVVRAVHQLVTTEGRSWFWKPPTSYFRPSSNDDYLCRTAAVRISPARGGGRGIWCLEIYRQQRPAVYPYMIRVTMTSRWIGDTSRIIIDKLRRPASLSICCLRYEWLCYGRTYCYRFMATRLVQQLYDV